MSDQTGMEQLDPKSNQFLVVGIGASAGGIDALHTFFEHVPPNSNAAYVVILHLSPDHDSQLVQLLQQVARISVQQVVDRTKIEPNHIYVIPPDKHLIMQDGIIVPSANTQVEDRRAPVDIFFRTLAEAKGARAVGVILSGTGANGSMGLKRIKEQGGAVFVQNPREAAFNEMPRNSIATGFVDEVLNVAELPAHILNYRNTLGDTYIPEDAAKRDEEVQQALREIFTQLRLRTGHDFTNYKRATLMRRIERRMAVRNLSELSQYAAFSNEHLEETQALLKDLLISVTNFFRDKQAFDALELEALPALFEGRTSEDQVRIWIPGCATGEEAYTIAMLCAERTLGVMDAPKVQIFATDIDETAIATAREGFYTLNDAADVSAERLDRFFNKEGDHYRVRRELRETILFAHHNFLKDPPFSRIDMISCRNVLIYLNRQAQERVMETFHFALRPEGFLMLGTSESVDMASDLFKSFNREQHIFQSRLAVNQRPIVVPESLQPLRMIPPVALSSHVPLVATPRTSFGELHFRLLEEYAPPSLIVTSEFDLLHTSQRAGRYLQMAGGEPTQAVLKLIREELRSELRNGLYQATQKGTPVTSLPLHVRTEDGTEHIRIHIRPALGAEDGKNSYLLVVFQPATDSDEQEQPILHTSDEVAARHLEDELARLRLLLRASNEQHEFQAEELKAGNEELQAMNEELRSATEELETSKEELQSINEELSTVNQELKVKVEEATMISNNLQNLINSTDIGTIFLDRSLRVVLFTPAIRSVYNLIPADYGRPLSDITSKLEKNTVLEDAKLVLEQLQRMEREAHTTDGRTVLVRHAPYRTEDDRIQGVVISLVDITERKWGEEALRQADERYRAMTDNVPVLIWETDESGPIFTNRHYTDFFGVSFEEIRGMGWAKFLHPDDIKGYTAAYQKAFERQESYSYECRFRRADGEYRWLLNTGHPHGEKRFVGFSADITENKRAEQALRASEEKYRSVFESIDEGLCIHELIIDDNGNITDLIFREVNEAFEHHTGVKNAQGKRVRELFPQVEQHWLDSFLTVYKTGEPVRLEGYQADANRWLTTQYSRIGGEGSRLIAAVFEDITERRQQEQKQQFLLKLSDGLRTQLTNIDVMLATAFKLLATHFDVMRAIYYEGEADEDTFTMTAMYEKDASPIPTQLRLSDFSPTVADEYRTGKTQMIVDTELEPFAESYRAIGLRAWLAVPIVQDGKLVTIIALHNKMVRHWTASDVQLLEQFAERIYATVETLRAEDDLRESEDRLRATMDSALDYAILNMDAQRIINSWSRGAELIFGFTEEEIIGETADLIFTPEDRAAGIPELETGTARRVGMAPDERWHLHKDGRRFYASGVMRPVYKEGNVTGYVKVARDMTRQKEAEEQLRISEERYRTALQSARMAAWDWDVATDTIVWNDQHYYILGLKPETSKVDAAYFTGFVHPEDRDRVIKALEEAVEKSGIYEAEFRIVRGDTEEEQWMSGFGRVVASGHDGRAARMVGVMYDITNRVKDNQKLRDWQLRLEIAQRAARIGIWGYDVETGRGIATPEWNDLTGYPHPGDTFELEVLLELIHPEDREKLVAAHTQVIEDHGTEELEFRLNHPERGMLWLLKRGQYIPGYNGTHDAIMGSMIDITERKLLEQQKDQFIGIASHELRTPVTSIKAYAEILEELFRDSGDGESARLMYKLDEQVDRLTSLIYALLDTTRITEGRLQLEMSSFDMTKLIRETAEAMQRIAGKHTIQLDLPDSVIAHGDRERIRQVLINLIGNAVKYSPDADKVTVQMTADEDEVTVCVQDEGIGISEEGQSKIFNRFFRDDETSTYSGLGLGLFISATIVQQHGGRISVQSEKRKGSLFCFTLPMVRL